MDNARTRCFRKLKEAVGSQPVRKLPNFTKSFEIHTDVSDVAYGAALIQDGYPIAYESKNISDIEVR